MLLTCVWLWSSCRSLSGLWRRFLVLDLGRMLDLGISNETAGGNRSGTIDRLLLGSQARTPIQYYGDLY